MRYCLALGYWSVHQKLNQVSSDTLFRVRFKRRASHDVPSSLAKHRASIIKAKIKTKTTK